MASIRPPALGAKGCVERLCPTGKTTHYILCVAPLEAMHSPFGGWRHHLPPHFVVGLWMLSHGAMSLQESIETYSAP